jgi:speckle-type POZ protein
MVARYKSLEPALRRGGGGGYRGHSEEKPAKKVRLTETIKISKKVVVGAGFPASKKRDRRLESGPKSTGHGGAAACGKRKREGIGWDSRDDWNSGGSRVESGPKAIGKTGKDVQELSSTRVSEFSSLLDDTTSADVTFVVNNERIPAHKIILAARSPYFRAMLVTEAQQGGSDIIIQDISPAGFRALLLYLYTDELAFDDTLLVDVLRKAKELELTRVYNHCEQRCQRGLSAHNAVLWFMQADEYALEGLRESTLRYLTRNLSKIRAVAKDTLAKLAVEKPMLMAEVMMTDV